MFGPRFVYCGLTRGQNDVNKTEVRNESQMNGAPSDRGGCQQGDNSNTGENRCDLGVPGMEMDRDHNGEIMPGGDAQELRSSNEILENNARPPA